MDKTVQCVSSAALVRRRVDVLAFAFPSQRSASPLKLMQRRGNRGWLQESTSRLPPKENWSCQDRGEKCVRTLSSDSWYSKVLCIQFYNSLLYLKHPLSDLLSFHHRRRLIDDTSVFTARYQRQAAEHHRLCVCVSAELQSLQQVKLRPSQPFSCSQRLPADQLCPRGAKHQTCVNSILYVCVLLC